MKEIKMKFKPAIFIPASIGRRVQYLLFNKEILIKNSTDELRKMYYNMVSEYGFEPDNKSGIIILDEVRPNVKHLQMWAYYNGVVTFSSKEFYLSWHLKNKPHIEMIHHVLEVAKHIEDIGIHYSYKGFNSIKTNWDKDKTNEMSTQL